MRRSETIDIINSETSAGNQRTVVHFSWNDGIYYSLLLFMNEIGCVSIEFRNTIMPIMSTNIGYSLKNITQNNIMGMTLKLK